MNPLESLIDTARNQAKQDHLARQMTERMFLLGIEIGRGAPLPAGDRTRYAQTLSTARWAMGLDEVLPQDDPRRATVEETIIGALSDWLAEAPKLKATLEEWFQRSLPENLDETSPEEFQKLKEQLRAVASATGQQLSDIQIDQLAQKLTLPLDRP